MIRVILFSTVSFLLFYAGSCSSYHVEGNIETDRKEIGLNDTLYLEALVTDEVEPFDVMWDLYPLDKDAELIFPVPNDTENNNFKAIFVARDTGEYRIAIRFLYKNTSPPESDAITVKVR